MAESVCQPPLILLHVRPIPRLRLQFLSDAQPMRFTFIVMVHDLQPEIATPFRERRPNIGHVRTPLPAELAIHPVLPFLVLQPHVRIQPIRSEPTALSTHPFRRRRYRRRHRLLYDGTFLSLSASRGFAHQFWRDREGSSREHRRYRR